MAYTPTTWVRGDTITSAGLNNIEGGISSLNTAVETLEAGSLSAATAQEGQSPIADGNGAWAWGDNPAVKPWGQVSSSNVASLGTSVTAWPCNRIYGIAGGNWKTGQPITDLPEYSNLQAALTKEAAMLDGNNGVYIRYVYTRVDGFVWIAHQLDGSSALSAWTQLTITATDDGEGNITIIGGA